MEIRQLEALVGIAEHGTFSGAAEALGTVQSNISNRIARLESELGCELVDRASGSITESGTIVVNRSRRILSELSAIASDVSELNSEVRGQVSVGMIGTELVWPRQSKFPRVTKVLNSPQVNIHVGPSVPTTAKTRDTVALLADAISDQIALAEKMGRQGSRYKERS